MDVPTLPTASFAGTGVEAVCAQIWKKSKEDANMMQAVLSNPGRPEYGVVYDNGMKLEQIYDGRFFPCYYYEPNTITVAVTSKAEPEDTEHTTWLFLPMIQEEIDRALQRAGIADPADARLWLEDSQLPDEVDVLLEMEYETLADLNKLAAATDGLSKADMEKLGAVVMLAEPKSAAQIKNLAESLDLFDLAPACIRRRNTAST